MSFIKKIENDYNEDLISLDELDDMRIKYSELTKKDKLILDQQNEGETIKEDIIDAPPVLHTSKESVNKKSLKVASEGWIIAGFIFAFLGGFLGIAIGSNYAFGNYKKSTKNLGWAMLIISLFSITILKSI